MLLRVKVALAAVAFLTAACGVWPSDEAQRRACTMIGCIDGLQISGAADVEPGARFTAELCIDGNCMSGRGRAGVQDKLGGQRGMTFDGPDELSLDVSDSELLLFWAPRDLASLEDGRPREVTLAVRSAGRQVVDVHQSVQFEPTWPNGKGCDPPCWQARIEV